MMKMSINDGKGLGVEFDNGVFLSIQIEGGNYCENYKFPIGEITRSNPLPPSKTAEIACWMKREEPWFDIQGDMVGGYIDVAKSFDLLAALSKLPNPTTREAVQATINAVITLTE